jgi:hypothetical protein
VTAVNEQTHKYRFRSMCYATGITPRQLYSKTLIDPRFIEALFVGIAIPQDIAVKLVDAFNNLSDSHYALEDFNIETV